MHEFEVMVLGGGFAGTTLARRLERKVPSDCRIGLVSQENYITYNPLLPEVVGASILPGHVVAPIRQITRRTQFCMATVTDIDLDQREIHYLGESSGVFHYDHLVLACGVIPNMGIVAGMGTYALPLKTLGDALFLRNRVMLRLEQAEMQENHAMRRWLTTFIVVGGGFSGVEVTGEITDFLCAALRYYPRLYQQDARVILLHAGDHLLPEFPLSLGAFALHKMGERDIDIRLNAVVASVDDQGVVLEAGDRVDGGTVICTIGTAPNSLIAQLDVPKQGGRVETEPDMSVPGYPGLWALGDCAAVVNAHNGRLSPPTAQFATQQAKQLADNLVRNLRGEPTRSFSYKPKGQMASIGHNKAVAKVFGLHLSGFVAWLLWRGFYLLKIPTLSRKVRLYFEWNWEMLFPPDTVHLRFSRTPMDKETQ